MASVTIGGNAIILPKLTFKRIKKVWPIVKGLQDSDFLNETDPEKLMPLMDEVIKVFAIAINDPPKTAEWIEENLEMPEMFALQGSLTELLIDSGLAERTPEGAKTGEATAEGTAESPSTVTGTDTLPISLPPVAPPLTGD